ncbi:Connectin [Nymphon striatum]|nr:Connectin [Nymphon striatum]
MVKGNILLQLAVIVSKCTYLIGQMEQCVVEMEDKLECECDHTNIHCFVTSSISENDWKDFPHFEYTSLGLSYHSDDNADFFPSPIFSNLRNLEYVYIKGAKFHRLPQFAMKNLSSLSLLYLDKNSIKNLDNLAISNLNRLTELNIHRNRIEEVKKGMFQDLPSLVHLNLGYNGIFSVEDEAFSDLRTLTELRLSWNVLTSIGSLTFLGLDSLEDLHLDHNRIDNIESTGLSSLVNLRQIWFNANRLTTLHPGTFNGLQNLVKIILRNNEIDTMSAGTFKNCCQNIERLDLRENNLKTLTKSWYEPLDFNVSEISFSFSTNSLDCSCDLEWLFELTANDFVAMQLKVTACRVTSNYPYPGKTIGKFYSLTSVRNESSFCRIEEQAIVLNAGSPIESVLSSNKFASLSNDIFTLITSVGMSIRTYSTNYSIDNVF